MQLRFSREELLSQHNYSAPNMIGGWRMHGGFDQQGTYIPPRSKVRTVAIANWTTALRKRGGEVFTADSSLLTGPRLPNVEQHRVLIRAGMSRVFWNNLTITGKIEGRGRMLATMPIPDLQNYILEDISEMAIGHLSEGLLYAHGIDEGGIPERGIGGHDTMWFVARDITLGEDAWPDVEPPERISRPETGERRMPSVAPELEAVLSFLMNLLMIEFRAEIGFAATQEILRTEGLFPGRSAEAEIAAEIVERIRTDEKIHVDSLRLYLGELSSVSVKTIDGKAVPGDSIIVPYWKDLVDWATGEQPILAARQSYESIKTLVRDLAVHESVQQEFDQLMDDGIIESQD